MILKLTWRNLWRNRRRSMITMTSVSFAVFLAVLMQSFQKGVFDNLVNNMVGFYSGSFQLHKTGYWNEQVIDNSFKADEKLFSLVGKVPGIREMVPRIETFILAASDKESKGCMLVGTDPVRENRLTGIAGKISSGSYFSTGENSVIMAEGLARRLHLSAGDTLILFGQGFQGSVAAGKFRIRGLVKFGSPALNDGIVFMPLDQARELLGAEQMLTSIAMSIDQPSQLDRIQEDIVATTGTEYEVLNWKELMPDIASHIKADRAGFYVFTGILYLIIAFGIFGTILMMTAERHYEFGMLIAVGMKKAKLGIVLFSEAMLITFLGVLSGILLSLPFMYYFNKNPLRLSGNVARAYEQFGFEALFPTAVDFRIVFTQSIIVLGIALIMGGYPLWHIHRLNPVTAMKK